MRSLVISDLHLGSRTGADVLRRRRRREPLLAAVADCERLVLLGDVIELRHARIAEAFTQAEPVLRELGAALGPDRDVVIVPGNHDHHLAAAWLERRSRQPHPVPLGPDGAVDWQAPEPLAAVAGWLAPARVSAAYPGLWLRADVYATHGHYLDRHTTVPMLERIAAGAMARLLREPAAGPALVADYEATLAPIYAWVHAVAQTGAHDLGDHARDPSTRGWRMLTAGDGSPRLRRRALALAFPGVLAALNRGGIGPLRADLSGAELRRAGLRALSEVLARLDVTAPYVIFGHTHRAGPLATDDRREWRTAAGGQLINCGSWLEQPDFLGAEPSRSPYRAGFAVQVDDHGPPQLVNLLDGVSAPVPA
ncbi:MAG: metallophosphoesterase family protein [Solirubrobacterales bacterium]|nr:metallophosphoesterase family protein [Solirubrobacterales bacterium]